MFSETTSIAVAAVVAICGSYFFEQASRRAFRLAAEAHIRRDITQLEAKRSEKLLLNILPSSVAEEVKNGTHEAREFPHCSVIFADIVDFTQYARETDDPRDLVKLLSALYTLMDAACKDLGVEKIKTIGDAYMAVTGAPNERDDHAEVMAKLAFEFLKITSNFKRPDGSPLQIRIGLNTGPLVAGVIGLTKFAYDVWGDTVNTAARMEAFGAAGRIHCTEEFYNLVQHKFKAESRGPQNIKGKGIMNTFFLTHPIDNWQI